MESQLAGAQKMVLTANPAAQAERLKKAAGPGVQGATLGTALRNPAAAPEIRGRDKSSGGLRPAVPFMRCLRRPCTGQCCT